MHAEWTKNPAGWFDAANNSIIHVDNDEVRVGSVGRDPVYVPTAVLADVLMQMGYVVMRKTEE